jgi:hypothetical protein
MAAGLITGTPAPSGQKQDGAGGTTGQVTALERMLRLGHRGAIVRTGTRDGVAWRLERKLFERGCAVFVLGTEHEDAARALAATGALVVLSGGPGIDVEVQSPATGVEPVRERLQNDDAEAAQVLTDLLERMRILMPVTGWIDAGGGI